jgi:hypothetical protein
MLGSKVKSAWLGTSTPLPGPHPVRLPGAPGTGTSELVRKVSTDTAVSHPDRAVLRCNSFTLCRFLCLSWASTWQGDGPDDPLCDT